MGRKIVFRIVEAIAKKYLGVETLTARHSDELDYKECSVWCLTKALEAAFKAGAEEERMRSMEYYRDAD